MYVFSNNLQKNTKPIHMHIFLYHNTASHNHSYFTPKRENKTNQMIDRQISNESFVQNYKPCFSLLLINFLTG